MTWREFGKLLISVLVCQFVGFIGSVFTTPAIPTWYAGLEKPSFTPPSSVFAPVWITLYLLMGISAYLVWHKGLAERRIKSALGVFAIQLMLNALWSVIFFGLHSPLGGLIEIIALWIVIPVTLVRFFPISTAAGVLLTPYFLWVGFAALLNFSIWSLN